MKKKKNNAGELETNPVALSALPSTRLFKERLANLRKEVLKTH